MPSSGSEFVHLQKPSSLSSKDNSNPLSSKPQKKVTIAQGFESSSESNSFVVLDSHTNQSNNSSSKNAGDDEQVQQNIKVFLDKFAVLSESQLQEVSAKYQA